MNDKIPLFTGKYFQGVIFAYTYVYMVNMAYVAFPPWPAMMKIRPSDFKASADLALVDSTTMNQHSCTASI